MLFDQPDARHAPVAACLVVDDTCAMVSCAMRLPDEQAERAQPTQSPSGTSTSARAEAIGTWPRSFGRNAYTLPRNDQVICGGSRSARLHVRPAGRWHSSATTGRCTLLTRTGDSPGISRVTPAITQAGGSPPIRWTGTRSSHAALSRKSPPRQSEDQSWPTNSRTTGASLGSCMAMCIVARTRPALLPQSKRVPSKR